MDKTKVKVAFSIYGEEFDTEELTRIIGISPTRQWNKGDIIRSNLFRKETCWDISTDYEESHDINDQLNKVILQLTGKQDEIKFIQTTYNAECKFDVVIQIENNDKPAMYIERDRIKFLNDISARIDFDLYIFS